MIEITVTREVGLVQSVPGAAIDISIEVMPEISARATQGVALASISVTVERDAD